VAKTLAQCKTRVYAILKVNPDKAAEGQYSSSNVTAGINTAQRFIVKSAIPASLGALVRLAEHPITMPSVTGRTEFPKDCTTGGRVLAVAYGRALERRVRMRSLDDWLDEGEAETWSSSGGKSYQGVEVGSHVYLRPDPGLALPVTFVEFYVDDPDDMATNGVDGATETVDMSLPSDWFEWLCICAAELLLLNGGDFAKLGEVRNMKVGWSAQFKGQYGMNPPSIEAPGGSGKVV
jgi:hypothetical protein